MKKLLISAFGIHTGGGLVLLESLIKTIGTNLAHAILDARVEGKIPSAIPQSKISYVKKNIFYRVMSNLKLWRIANSNHILICFNSLPPLIRPSCQVVVFVHAPHFANLHREIKYNFITSVRFFLERLWFKVGVHNCDEIWVQTSSMREFFRFKYPNLLCRVMPFVDDILFENQRLIEASLSQPIAPKKIFSFFFPAEYVGHKNHINLIKAWGILRKEGFEPNLILTIRSSELKTFCEEFRSLTHIKYLGKLTRQDSLLTLSQSSALIFPSFVETLGLPLLEATNIGIPILASERDYVRDVCAPTETFDPTSPRSIARAVRRFMNNGEKMQPLISTSVFIEYLLSLDKLNKSNSQLFSHHANSNHKELL